MLDLKPHAWSCLPEVCNPDGPVGAMKCSNFSMRAISLWHLQMIQQTFLKRRSQQTNPQSHQHPTLLENPLLLITGPLLWTNVGSSTLVTSIFHLVFNKDSMPHISTPVPLDLYLSFMWGLWFLFRSGSIFMVVNHRADDAAGEMKVHFCAAMFWTSLPTLQSAQHKVFFIFAFWVIFGTICVLRMMKVFLFLLILMLFWTEFQNVSQS